MNRRSSWVAWSVAVLAIALGGIGIWIGLVNAQPVGFEIGALLVAVIPFTLVGALIASRFPQNPIGWIFCAVGSLQGLESASYQYAFRAVILEPGTLPLGGFAAWVAFWAWMPSLGLLTTFLFLLFPNGHTVSSRWRWVGWTAGIGLGLIVLGAGVGGALASPRVLISDEAPAGFSPVAEAAVVVGFFVVLVASLAALASLVVRFRRSSGDERQQLKWMAFAASFALIAILVQFLPAVLPEVFGLLMAVGLLAVPVASGVAILKYRLYDIDLVINKTVVYGALAAFVTVVYVGIVVGIGALVGTRGNPFLSILATAVIALAFHPVRQWARHIANRLVYGKRATPYEVLSRLAQGMGSQYSADEALPSLARVLAEGTGAARAEVWLRLGGELRPAAAWPEGRYRVDAIAVVGGALPRIPSLDAAIPVEHDGELLGALGISLARGETLTAATEKLLADVASHAGLVLRNVRLIEELRASRQRLVAAQDQERRRLERNIHDGAQQQLVALSVKLRLAENLARKDPDKAAETMAQVRSETQQALDDLRDLARGIYPPLLADKGLAAAIESQARKAVLPVAVEPDGVGRYPQEAEAAAYFCVLEALQNVSKYAGASTAVVRLSEENGDLVFAVTDDGRGFDTETTPRGSGLQNMADRVDALGGRFEIVSRPNQGTTVKGRIPVQRVASAQASSSRSGSNSDLGM